MKSLTQGNNQRNIRKKINNSPLFFLCLLVWLDSRNSAIINIFLPYITFYMEFLLLWAESREQGC